MDNNIAIKIAPEASFAKCVKIIRNIESLSIGEIKARIDSGNYVLEYDYCSDSGIKKIIKCYKALSKEGISCELYEHNRITSIDFLTNLKNTYSEIDEYMSKTDWDE